MKVRKPKNKVKDSVETIILRTTFLKRGNTIWSFEL